MTLWRLRNPHSLPMVITFHADGTVRADFPGIEGCSGMGIDVNVWKARDQAILNCARSMVEIMEGAHDVAVNS
jgi:hypothetical protein